MPTPSPTTARSALLRTVEGLTPDEVVYAHPGSTQRPVAGRTVEVSGLCLAIRTDTAQVVWVHVEDCPDLVRRSAVRPASGEGRAGRTVSGTSGRRPGPAALPRRDRQG